MLAIAQDEVTRMYGEGIIERSARDFSSAPLILRKSDGTHRPCIDYGAINYAEPNICRR